RSAFFLEPDRFLDGDLVERVHRHLDVGKLDAGPICLDADFDVEIDHPLYGHQYFHTWKLPPRAARKLWSTPRPVNAIPSGAFRAERSRARAAHRPAACTRTAVVPDAAAAPPAPRRRAFHQCAPTTPYRPCAA